MFSLYKLILISNLIISLTYSEYYQNLLPRGDTIQTDDYNSDRISIDFDTICLGDIDPREEVDELLELYNCLIERPNDELPDYFYNKIDKLSRVYLDILNKGSCLSNNQIFWIDYCIVEVKYEIMLSIDEINSIETTNTIIYDNGKSQAVPWQLDFLDGIENDNQYNHYNGMELYGDRELDIWILDTGVYQDHKEFFVGQIIDEYTNFTQGHPHGTGTAASAGGTNYGVAKKFYIHDYPVCQYGGSCGSADIFAGLTKALNYLQQGKGKRSVINMSLGTGISDINYFTNMFDEITNAGGIVVVASGNWGDDACLHNYAYYSNLVISVGSHDSSKIRATSSSYGTCVHIYAPGVNIATAYSYTDPYITQYKSGTSFASPITAGKIANLLHENPTLSRNEIVSILQTQNIYPVSGCDSGYCYGSYHNFTINSNYINGNYLKYEKNTTISISTINLASTKIGITSELYVDANAIINGFSIRVDIIHNNRSNLILTLTSPNNKSIKLNASNSLDNEPNIHTIFFPNEFDNLNMLGIWTLNIIDSVGKYAGRLDYWNMKFYTKSTIIKVAQTTTTQSSSCTCKGSRKCTAYLSQSDCIDYSGCYWGC